MKVFGTGKLVPTSKIPAIFTEGLKAYLGTEVNVFISAKEINDAEKKITYSVSNKRILREVHDQLLKKVILTIEAHANTLQKRNAVLLLLKAIQEGANANGDYNKKFASATGINSKDKLKNYYKNGVDVEFFQRIATTPEIDFVEFRANLAIICSYELDSAKLSRSFSRGLFSSEPEYTTTATQLRNYILNKEEEIEESCSSKLQKQQVRNKVTYRYSVHGLTSPTLDTEKPITVIKGINSQISVYGNTVEKRLTGDRVMSKDQIKSLLQVAEYIKELAPYHSGISERFFTSFPVNSTTMIRPYIPGKTLAQAINSAGINVVTRDFIHVVPDEAFVQYLKDLQILHQTGITSINGQSTKLFITEPNSTALISAGLECARITSDKEQVGFEDRFIDIITFLGDKLSYLHRNFVITKEDGGISLNVPAIKEHIRLGEPYENLLETNSDIWCEIWLNQLDDSLASLNAGIVNFRDRFSKEAFDQGFTLTIYPNSLAINTCRVEMKLFSKLITTINISEQFNNISNLFRKNEDGIYSINPNSTYLKARDIFTLIDVVFLIKESGLPALRQFTYEEEVGQIKKDFPRSIKGIEAEKAAEYTEEFAKFANITVADLETEEGRNLFNKLLIFSQSHMNAWMGLIKTGLAEAESILLQEADGKRLIKIISTANTEFTLEVSVTLENVDVDAQINDIKEQLVLKAIYKITLNTDSSKPYVYSNLELLQPPQLLLA